MVEIASSFSLHVQLPSGEIPLTVVSFRGREDLSRPFAWDVRVVAAPSPALDESLLGVRARLLLDLAGGAPRSVEGLIASVRADAASVVRGQRTATLRLVPRLWLLKQRVASRIFQELTVPEIVGRVLYAAEVPHAMRLERSYARRDYCVQYQESDLAFVSRISAEEGIFFAFDGDAVVFLDRASGYLAPEGDPVLHVREGASAGLVGEDDVAELSVGSAVRPSSVQLSDYDFQRPLLDRRVDARAISPRGVPELEVVDHRGEYLAPELDAERAASHLEQWRARARVGRGRSACRRLAPGRRFRIEAEAVTALSGDYAITSVRHEGHVPGLTSHGASPAAGDRPQVYSNRFECVPATVPARPRRPKRPMQTALESGVVVGPPGEEIHTDEHGRIKVQFHWDRDGRLDDHSSCWIRVMQAWAGASWGSQILPRVGMEVMVSFLGGDRDCPVVTGCVYNATHPPPFILPGNKTRSGLRTQSTPGGGGFNELSFQDAAGEEHVYLHAQRDLEEVVGNRRDREVRGDESVRVLGARTMLVHGDRVDTTEGESTRTVYKDETVTVEGNRLDVVTGNLEQRVTGGSSARIVGRDRRDVEGRADLTVRDDYTVRVTGCLTTVVGRHDAKRSWVTRAEGIVHLSGADGVEIDAEKGVTLRCGKSFLRIGADRIELVSPSVVARGDGGVVSVGDDRVKLSAKKEALVTSDALLITSGASMSLREDVQLDGKKILLNSPDQVTAPVLDPSPPPTTLQMKDAAGKPLAHQRFLITLEGGAQYSGVLDEEGKAVLELEGSGTVIFPDMASPTAS